MIIGFDAKRAFQNNTGLGNYSRMLICGLAQEHQDVYAVLYAPNMSGDYKLHFSGYANISTRQPSGFDRYLPDLWRGFGIAMHLTGDKVKLYHGLSHELPHGIPHSIKKVVTMHDLLDTVGDGLSHELPHGIPHSIKKVVTMHDLIVWRFPQYFKRFDRIVHRLKQKHSCKNADIVVAISKQTKRDLIDIMHVPEEKIRVLYQSCDQIFWQPIPEDDKNDIKALYHLPEKYFVCVGTIEERKNQVAAVQALNLLPKDIHLVIVGRPQAHYYFELQRTIRELELNDRVHVISRADFEDFPGLYANAIGSVYVSKFEGFGIPILESMCCDTPVITSNCSSMPEAGGNAALYVNPEDPQDIAAKMRMLLEQPTLREDLIAKGRVQREKFTQSVIIDQFYKLYKELIGEEEEVEN